MNLSNSDNSDLQTQNYRLFIQETTFPDNNKSRIFNKFPENLLLSITIPGYIRLI